MSDTAFFVRPVLPPAKAAVWLRLDGGNDLPRTASRWSFPLIPDLDRLTAGLASGDEGSVRDLVRHLYPQMAQLARALAPQKQSETELTGAMIAVVLRRLRKRPAGAATLNRWAARLAIKQALREMERDGIDLRIDQASRAELQQFKKLATGPGDQSPPDQQVARQLFARLLSQLAPKHRLVITLTEIDGWTIDELAGQTGWPMWLVRVRVHFAKRRFQKLLKNWLIKSGKTARAGA